MEKRQFSIGLILLFLLVILSYGVYAQNLLNDVFEPLSGFNVGETYAKYWYVIDCIMYCIILIGAAQFALSQQFEGKGGKAVIIGVGISLAIAASFFEYKYNFKLIDKLGPAAIIVLLLIFCMAFYRLTVSLGGNARVASMLGFSILFFYVNSQFPMINQWIRSSGSGWLKLIWGLMNILAIVFLVWGIWGLIAALRGEGDDTTYDPVTGRPTRHRPRPGPGPLPGEPVNVPQFGSAESADNAVILQWDNPGDVEGYEIQMDGRSVHRITNPAHTFYIHVFNPPAPGNHTFHIRAFVTGRGLIRRWRRRYSEFSNPIDAAPSTPAARIDVSMFPAVGPYRALMFLVRSPGAAGATSFFPAELNGRAFTMYIINPANTGFNVFTMQIDAPYWVHHHPLPPAPGAAAPPAVLFIEGLNANPLGDYLRRRGEPLFNTQGLA